MHHDLDAVERISLVGVIADVAAAGDFLPVVPGQLRVVIKDRTARRGGQPAVDLDAELPLRKGANLALDLVPLPGVHSREAELLHFDQRVKVVDRQVADDGLSFKLLQVERLHVRTFRKPLHDE